MQSSFTQKPAAPLNEDDSAIDEYSSQSRPSFAGSSALMQALQAWQVRLATDETLRSRILTHGTMVLVVMLVIALSQLELPWGTINTIKPIKYRVDQLPVEGENAEQVAPLTLPTELSDTQDGVLVRGAVPRTTILEQPQTEPVALGNSGTALGQYTVEPGDTITGIAEKFGVNVETIVWSNPELELNPDLLSVGQTLTILPVDGVYHQVGGNDTIAGIAATFKTDPQLIIDYPSNELDPDNLIIQPGQWLVVPGGSKPFKPRTVTAYTGPIPEGAVQGSGIFGWPATGSISQAFFGYHPGLDIAGWQGATVSAADSGYVISAGWDNTGYGLSVVVDHGNGFQSLYAHLNDTYVAVGDNVTKGQQLGEMGCTGNCTGPHLHFEIRHGTVQRNPYGFLP